MATIQATMQQLRLTSFVLATLVTCLTLAAATPTGRCDANPPRTSALECRIAAADEPCFLDPHYSRGWTLDSCSDRASCYVWTGMQLKISCDEEGGNSTYLDVYTENSTQGQRKLSWPFATKSIVEGVYSCRRRDDGALISNRSVIVDGN